MHRQFARLGAVFGLLSFAACTNEVASPAAPEYVGQPRLATGPASFSWKGVLWSVSTNADASIDGNGNAVLLRTGAGENTLTSAGDPTVNDNGTPWMLFSYEDDAVSQQGFDLFINYNSSGPRLSAGSLFSVPTGFGYERYNTGPAIEQPLFCAGCTGTGRVAGRHTIYIGQRADGTTDMNFDGVWYSGTFLKDNGQTPFAYAETMLRRRGGLVLSTATYYDFRKGDNHPAGGNKDACKNGGWTASGLFGNQGQCIQFANTGK